MKVFAEFHRSGVINQSTNATFIALLPKKSQTKKFQTLDLLALSLVLQDNSQSLIGTIKRCTT